MAIKPILFNTEMVRAILDGRKSCTRRLVKLQPDEKHIYPLGFVTDSTEKKEVGCFGFGIDEYGGSIQYVKPPYQPGDILYVRETWSEWTDGYVYKAWNEPFPQAGQMPIMKWHPSIHMPKEAARIWLKVTGVRVEQLQDMKDEDCEKEGLENFCKKCSALFSECDACLNDGGIKEDFKELWNSTIKKSDIDTYGWGANPWVWVIEFERCEKPKG